MAGASGLEKLKPHPSDMWVVPLQTSSLAGHL